MDEKKEPKKGWTKAWWHRFAEELCGRTISVTTDHELKELDVSDARVIVLEPDLEKAVPQLMNFKLALINVAEAMVPDFQELPLRAIVHFKSMSEGASSLFWSALKLRYPKGISKRMEIGLVNGKVALIGRPEEEQPVSDEVPESLKKFLKLLRG